MKAVWMIVKVIRGSVAAARDAWILAMQAEVDSLKGNHTFEEASAQEIKKLHYRDSLPMKLVTGG